MKSLHRILLGFLVFHVWAGGGRLQATTNYEGALEYWINTSSNTVPLSLGFNLRAGPGAEPFVAPTVAWDGKRMAYPGLVPGESLPAALFIQSSMFTNSSDGELYLEIAIDPISIGGLSNGATNVTPEPMPVYAPLASSFAQLCSSVSPVNGAGGLGEFVAQAMPDCLTCPNDNCTEALRKEIERLIKILRKQKVFDEAALLEEILEEKNVEVDRSGRVAECGVALCYNIFSSPTPTILISPSILCKTNAAALIAATAAVLALQYENSVLRDELGAEAAVLILATILDKDTFGREFKEFKKIMESLVKPLHAVEGPFPIFTCLVDILCKASNYQGTDSDDAKDLARKIKDGLQKIKDLCKAFDRLTQAQKEAVIQGMIARFNAIIVAIKARNWVALEGLGIPRGCIDPNFLRFADEFQFSTTNLVGKLDAPKADRNQTQDLIVPTEVENTVRIYPGIEDLQFGPSVPIRVSGGPHIAVSLDLLTENTGPVPGDPYFAGVGTRDNGVAVIRRNESGFTVVPLLGPTEIIALHALDANGDGSGDLVAVADRLDAPSIVTFLRRPDAAFPFETEPSVPCPAMSLRIAAGDWNGDGRIDLALARPGFVAVFHQVTNPVPGAARWVPGPTLPGVAMPADLQVADIDGDHRMDLVAADFQNSRVQVWLNDSPGGLRPGNFFSFAEPVTAVAVGDLDGNGVPDLLAGLGETPRLALQMNPSWDSPPAFAGPGALPEILFINLMAPASQLLLRDLDGDNDQDLLAATAGGFQIFRRLFNRPIVECSLRIPMIRVTTNTLIIDRATIHPEVLAGPFKLLYRDHGQSEWSLVPASDILSMTTAQWILRRPSNSFRLFRIIADTPP